MQHCEDNLRCLKYFITWKNVFASYLISSIVFITLNGFILLLYNIFMKMIKHRYLDWTLILRFILTVHLHRVWLPTMCLLTMVTNYVLSETFVLWPKRAQMLLYLITLFPFGDTIVQIRKSYSKMYPSPSNGHNLWSSLGYIVTLLNPNGTQRYIQVFTKIFYAVKLSLWSLSDSRPPVHLPTLARVYMPARTHTHTHTNIHLYLIWNIWIID